MNHRNEIAATIFTLGSTSADLLNALNAWLIFFLNLVAVTVWVRAAVKNRSNKPPKPPTLTKPPRRGPDELLLAIFFLVPFVALLSGCSTLDTTVTETSAGDKETHVKIRTFWDAKSELAKMHTTSTDKTQSVSVSGLTQESSATNAVNLIEAIARGAVQGATGKP